MGRGDWLGVGMGGVGMSVGCWEREIGRELGVRVGISGGHYAGTEDQRACGRASLVTRWRPWIGGIWGVYGGDHS